MALYCHLQLYIHTSYMHVLDFICKIIGKNNNYQALVIYTVYWEKLWTGAKKSTVQNTAVAIGAKVRGASVAMFSWVGLEGDWPGL